MQRIEILLFLLVVSFSTSLQAQAQAPASAPKPEPKAETWSDPSRHKSGFVTANGVRLNYLDWGGSGPALILIHGIFDNPHIFDDLAPVPTENSVQRFSTSCSVVTFPNVWFSRTSVSFS